MEVGSVDLFNGQLVAAIDGELLCYRTIGVWN